MGTGLYVFRGREQKIIFITDLGGLTQLSVPVIWILSGEARVVCSIFRALGLPS